jgi:hypothetical protein
VDALNGLFTGVNVGKTLVRLSEPGAGSGRTDASHPLRVVS